MKYLDNFANAKTPLMLEFPKNYEAWFGIRKKGNLTWNAKETINFFHLSGT